MPVKPLVIIPDLPKEAERAITEHVNRLVAQINAQGAGKKLTPLKTSSYLAKEGEIVRIKAGLQLTLPRPRVENQNADIGVLVESSGTLTVNVNQGLINDASSLTVPGPGLVFFKSNGSTSWFSGGNLPAAGDSLAYSGETLNYTGTTNDVVLNGITGAQGVVDISNLVCGGRLGITAPTGAWSISGFTAKTEGFWFILTAASTDFVGTIINSTTANTGIRNPSFVDFSCDRQISGMVMYGAFGGNSQWVFIPGASPVSVSVEPQHHITTNSAGAIIYRKSRFREFWHEEFTFSDSVAAGAAITTSGRNTPCQSTNWWMVATSANGTFGPVASTNNHMGILRLTTSTTDNSSVQIYNGVANTVGYDTYRGDEIYMFEAIIRIPTVTSILIVAGFQDTAANNAMMFLADTDTGSSNWKSFVAEGGVSTTTDTGTAMSANAWVVLTIVQETVGTVDFYIDDVLEDTQSTNIPDSETVGLLLAVFTRTTAARIMDVDYVSFESQSLGSRTS